MTAHQPDLGLGVLRRIRIEDEPGKVILRVMAGREETVRLEFTPDEADSVARHMYSASACASSSKLNQPPTRKSPC
jgi:hypothetical protein